MWVCTFKQLTGVPCPGCGITRALVCLFKLDFVGAWSYNPMIYMHLLFVLLLVTVRKRIKLMKALVCADLSIAVLVWLISIITGDIWKL